MWSHHQCHPGFLTEVFRATTSLSAGGPGAVHWELVPSVGLGKPFLLVWLGGAAGRWPCVTHQSVHKHRAVGGRGLGLQPQRGPGLAGCLKLTLYSALCGQTSTNAPGEWLELENEEGA